MNNTQAANTPAAPASGSQVSAKGAPAPAKAATAAVATMAPSAGTLDKGNGLKLTPGLGELTSQQVLDAFLAPTGVAIQTPKQKEGDGDATTKDGDGDGEGTGTGDGEGEGTGTGEGEGDGTGTGDGEGEGTGTGEGEGEGDGTGTGDGEGEGTGTGEGEGEGDLIKGLDKAVPNPKLRKRIKALFAENPQLKRELAELKASKDATPRVYMKPDKADPLAAVLDEVALTQAQEGAEWWLDWCDANPQGGVLNEGTEHEQEVTAEQVVTQKQLARRILKSIPERKQYLTNYADTVKALGADVVEAIVGEKADGREAKALKTAPEFTRNPDYLQILADAKAGRERREKEAKGIKFVEVAPGAKAQQQQQQQAKAAGAGTATQATATQGSKQTDTQQAPPKSGAQQVPTKSTAKPVPLDQLRARAMKGDKTAQDAIAAAFLAAS